MANLYIGQFRDILKMYYEKQKGFNSEIDTNNQRFSPEYAESENAKVREKQAQAYANAKQSINSIFESVRACLANATYLNPESISRDTMALFDDANSFNLTESDIYAQIEKHEGNFVMLRFIQNWIDRHNTPAEGKMFGKYENIKITMPSDQLEVYRQFAESALSICDKIYTNANIMIDPIEIDHYADERMAGNLLEIIGSGMKLSDYKSQIVPETVKHTFDNVTLTLNKGNGNLYIQ